MTLLKLKGHIYRYTGIFLARDEENEYITSKEFWKSWTKSIEHPENDMSPRNLQGLMIGMWHADHGFVRAWSRAQFKRPRFFWNFVAWFDTLFKTIKWDIEKLFRRKK